MKTHRSHYYLTSFFYVKNKEVIIISIFDGISSQINARRSGLAGDPFVSKSESLKCSVGRIVLTEIPNKAAGITFTNASTTYFVNDYTLNQLPNSTTISVDWNNGVCYLDPAQEGLTILCVYTGMGVQALSASRVFTAQSNGVITQTLDTVVAKASSFQYLGAYNPATTYAIFNIVFYLGTSFICNASTSTGNLPTNQSFWGKLAGTNYQGTYSISTTYNSGDYVMNATADTIYISMVDANLNQPLTNTAKWQSSVSVATAITNANTATTNANTATSSANTATTNATNATTAANTATSNANTATTSANNASTLANNTANALSHKGQYSGATAYVPNNIVNYQGTAFMNILAGTGQTPSSSSTYWKKMNNFINQGTYSTSVTYMYGDCVVDSVNQNVYMSIIDTNLNQLLSDTSKWQLLVTVASAVTSANTATTNATTATTNANTATTAANTATSNANTATSAANNAATSANSLVTTFVSKGTYNGATAYVPNNTVIYGGSSWRCLQNTTNNLPVEGVNWTLVAQAGANGAGTVASITSTDASIAVAGTAQTPDLSVQTGITANKIPKRDANGNIPNSGLQITAKSANATLLLTEVGIIDVTTAGSTITITLPSAATTQLSYIIKKVDSGIGSITIATTSSQLIDGVSTKSIAYQYGYIQVVSDGSNWQVIDGSVNVTSTTGDITIANPTSNPALTVVTGNGASVIPKRDANGNIQNIGYQVIPISANTTLTPAQSGIINVTTAATPVTITLPTAVGNAQLVYTIKKADSGVGTVNIVTTSSQTIDGLSTKTITNQYADITIVSDGANWLVDVDNSYDKIGVLSSLTTTDKTSLVNATNENVTNLTSHLADNVQHFLNNQRMYTMGGMM